MNVHMYKNVFEYVCGFVCMCVKTIHLRGEGGVNGGGGQRVLEGWRKKPTEPVGG